MFKVGYTHAFEVGDKVICVDASPHIANGKDVLFLDAIYQISYISPTQVGLEGVSCAWNPGRFKFHATTPNALGSDIDYAAITKAVIGG